MVDTAALVDVYLQNLEGRKKVKHRDQDAEITHEQPQGQKPSREARKGYKSHLWFWKKYQVGNQCSPIMELFLFHLNMDNYLIFICLLPVSSF